MQQTLEVADQPVVIRPVAPADAEGTLVLIGGIAAEGMYFALDPDEIVSAQRQRERIEACRPAVDCWLVVEAEGQIVGQITASRDRRRKAQHTAHVGMGLAPAFRGHGLGGRLLQGVEEWARSVGVRKLGLGVLATNGPALRLYKRLGYVVEGVERRAFLMRGVLVDHVVMGKWLG